MKDIYIFLLLVLSPFAFINCTTTSQIKDLGLKEEFKTSLISTNSQTVDGIICSVGGKPILLSELQKAVHLNTQGKGQLHSDGTTSGNISKENVKEILELLIIKIILTLKVKEHKLSLAEDDLTKRIRDFLAQQGLTEDDLEKNLSSAGENIDNYRNEFRNQVEKEILISHVLMPLVSVSNDDVTNFYFEESGAKKQIKNVSLRVIRLDSSSKKEESEVRLKNLQNDLQNNENFTSLVIKYSDAHDKDKTQGLLPDKPLTQLPKELQHTLASAKKGSVIGPIKIGSSQFFFEFLGAKLASNNELQRNFENWKNKLLNKKILAKFEEYMHTERGKMDVQFYSLDFLTSN
jgi:peptidyl-prolyl cis-trans isomerase SurA